MLSLLVMLTCLGKSRKSIMKTCIPRVKNNIDVDGLGYFLVLSTQLDGEICCITSSKCQKVLVYGKSTNIVETEFKMIRL